MDDPSAKITVLTSPCDIQVKVGQARHTVHLTPAQARQLGEALYKAGCDVEAHMEEAS